MIKHFDLILDISAIEVHTSATITIKKKESVMGIGICNISSGRIEQISLKNAVLHGSPHRVILGYSIQIPRFGSQFERKSKT